MSYELLEKIDSKLDKVIEDINEIKIIQSSHGIVQEQQEKNLQEHMKRSDLLESMLTHLKEKEVAPIKNDINQVKGAYKLLTIIGAATIAILGLLLKFLGH